MNLFEVDKGTKTRILNFSESGIFLANLYGSWPTLMTNQFVLEKVNKISLSLLPTFDSLNCSLAFWPTLSYLSVLI